MSIKVKAIEKNISFDKNSEKWAYVLQPELYSRLSASKVIAETSTRSGLSKDAIAAAWTAIGDVITAWATEGHSVVVPGLGTMRFGLRCTSVGGVGANLVTSRRVIFTPTTEMKQQLATTGGDTGSTTDTGTGDSGTSTGTDDDDLGGNVGKPQPSQPNPTRRPTGSQSAPNHRLAFYPQSQKTAKPRNQETPSPSLCAPPSPLTSQKVSGDFLSQFSAQAST